MKMLMEIDPLPTRGSLVMTMAMIAPSRREVSPAEQLCRSPRLVPPRFRLVAAVFRPARLLMIFFQGRRHHIAKDGHRRPARGPTRQGARPRVRARPHPRGQGVGPLWYLFRSVFFIIPKMTSWSSRTFGVVQNRFLIFAPFQAAGILPLHVNLVK